MIDAINYSLDNIKNNKSTAITIDINPSNMN